MFLENINKYTTRAALCTEKNRLNGNIIQSSWSW